MKTRDEILSVFTQTVISGGMNTAPEARLLLFALATFIHAQTILETGYDAGYTTEILEMTGAKVIAIDNGSEYPEVKKEAKERLSRYTNCKLLDTDALSFLRDVPDEMFDLIFIDDDHTPSHVKDEVVEVRRILKTGGLVVFHDTEKDETLKRVVNEGLADWEILHLPAWCKDEGGVVVNFGLTVARKK